MRKLVMALCALALSSFVLAQEMTFVREYTYKASEMDSKNSCRAIAINQLRSLLLNEVGVYVESESILKTSDVNGKFAQDFVENIATISAGITKLEVLEEKWNGEEFWMKASIKIDKKSLGESLKQLISDRQKVIELEEIKQQLTNAQNEIDKLKKELSKGGDHAELSRSTDVYNIKISALRAGDYLLNGNMEFSLGHHQAAKEAYSKAIELGQNDSKTYFKIGTTKYFLQEYVGAIEYYTKSISIDPENIGAIIYRADAEDKIKDYDEAISDYSKVINIDSSFESAYRGRGDVRNKTGNFRGAMVDYTKAIDFYIRARSTEELDANIHALGPFEFRVETYRLRGSLKHKLQNYEGAIEDYNKAIKLYSNSSIAYYGRGLSRDSLQDFVGAIADYTKAIDINPKYALAYFARGIDKIALKQKDSGCSDLNKANELGSTEANNAVRSFCH